MTLNIKQMIKKAILYVAPMLKIRTNLSPVKARNILESYSACPRGTCIADNLIEIKYDLHIIIPVYNAEKYLKSCIDSVLNQITHYKYLVTIINDGSTDNSGQILARILDDSRTKSNDGLVICAGGGGIELM